MGCEGLWRALWQTRPRLMVCGHVHEGRGVERVRWQQQQQQAGGGGQGSVDGVGGEASVDWCWQEEEDPGKNSGKLSVVVLDPMTRGARSGTADADDDDSTVGQERQEGEGEAGQRVVGGRAAS